jgi:LmbE family N-acetylglucosaminyl deacetylase
VTTLVISPHLDDAVLSLGGAIAAWAETEPVTIASVYTSGPALADVPRSMRKWADYATRRREDAAACATVGAVPRWLDRIETAFRPPYLTGTKFFRTPSTRDGFTGLAGVAAALAPLLAPAPDRIAIPIGIGNHVDHVETMIAATDVVLAHGLADRVVFYEDFYALSGAMRRAHWLATRHRWRPWQAPLLRARRLAVKLARIAVARHGPAVETWLAPAWRHAAWRMEPIELADRHETTKLAAIARYRSQTRAFGGGSGIERALRAYHAWWGGAEPVWRATITAQP